MSDAGVQQQPRSMLARLSAVILSRTVVWLFLLAWVVVLLSVRRIAESDIWYHLRNAKQIVETFAVPSVDLYTFTSAGAPILDYEWLSELFYYAAFQNMGQRGLLAVYVVLLLASYGGVYYLACRRGADRSAGAVVTILGVAIGSYSFGPRMMHFGWLCLVVLMLILEASERKPWALWFLPLLFAIWINLHGSWIFGLVVMGATMVDGVLALRWGGIVATGWLRGAPGRLSLLGRASLVVCASVLALFANPYGWKLVWYPFAFRFEMAAALEAVTEWQSVNFHTDYGTLALTMIVGLLATAWLSKDAWRVRDVVLTAFALWASLTYVRFLGFASLVLVPIVAPRLRFVARDPRVKESYALNLALVLGLTYAIVGVTPSESEISAHIRREFPRDALKFMVDNRIEGRLFNAYDFGGYMEWHVPSLKTFADGRTDIFVYNGVMQDYLKTIAIDSTFERLERYDIDYVIYPPGSRLSYVLGKAPQWRSIYGDSVAVVFERTRPAN